MTTPLAKIFNDLVEGQRALQLALQVPEHELPATESLVLALLEAGPTHTPSDLAHLTGLSRGRITHLTDSLKERGYITKSPDVIDRRRMILSITADGKEAAGAALHLVEGLEKELCTVLGPAGVDMLAQQLDYLKRLSRPRP